MNLLIDMVSPAALLRLTSVVGVTLTWRQSDRELLTNDPYWFLLK